MSTADFNDSFYSDLDQESLTFLKQQIGIEDDHALKQHITAIQTKAYQVYKYTCIHRYWFANLKISRLPAYERALSLSREREHAIFLDIGCCFGNDTRKIVADGWPLQNVVASDLRQEFWGYGHELFMTTQESFPATFVAGDAFDIAPRAPFYETPLSPRPDLRTLTSLTPLQGHISAIHASSFFHLFEEDKQLELAQRLATLLSPLAGSVIFGAHIGMEEKGYLIDSNLRNGKQFCHSPDSWREMWDGPVFEKGTVKVEADLRLRQTGSGTADLLSSSGIYYLRWSVTRL